jgi:hypothetical protein
LGLELSANTGCLCADDEHGTGAFHTAKSGRPAGTDPDSTATPHCGPDKGWIEQAKWMKRIENAGQMKRVSVPHAAEQSNDAVLRKGTKRWVCISHMGETVAAVHVAGEKKMVGQENEIQTGAVWEDGVAVTVPPATADGPSRRYSLKPP